MQIVSWPNAYSWHLKKYTRSESAVTCWWRTGFKTGVTQIKWRYTITKYHHNETLLCLQVTPHRIMSPPWAVLRTSFTFKLLFYMYLCISEAMVHFFTHISLRTRATWKIVLAANEISAFLALSNYVFATRCTSSDLTQMRKRTRFAQHPWSFSSTEWSTKPF